jgi:DivIVA domain-containing protein
MELTPQAIRVVGFTTVKRGYDPDEVDSFKARVAEELEAMQAQAQAMEARARAAVAKLQELTQQGLAQRSEGDQPTSSPAPPAPASSSPAGAAAGSGDVPDMIARTLLLAQRTADAAIADARREADALVSEGREEASRLLESARAMAARTVDDARHEARRSAEDERVRIENEVQALLARRDFLVSDVDHLELYIQTERERLRDAANQLFDLIDRVPGGLGETRRPLLSAAAETDSFWVEPTAGTAADTADATMAIGDVLIPDDALPLFPAVSALADSGAIVGDGRELVDATVEVLHRLLPNVDAAVPSGAPAYDDWDDSGPTTVSRSDAATGDPWSDEGLPESSHDRSAGGFDDDSFWAMPRPEGDQSFADLSDEIPRPALDVDATVPMPEPTPVNGDLRIGGDDLD